MSVRDIVQAAAGNIAGGLRYVGGKTSADTGGALSISLTNLTGGISSAPAENDIVIIVIGVAHDSFGIGALSVSGYTTIASFSNMSSFSDQFQYYVGYKIMGVTPDTTVSVTTSSPRGVATAIQVFRGVDVNVPFDVLGTRQGFLDTATAVTNINSPSITPITTDAVVIGIGVLSSANTDTLLSCSNLTNVLSVRRRAASGVSTRTASVAMGFAKWTSGAFDPNVWVPDAYGNNAGQGEGLTLALRPEIGSSAPTISFVASSTYNSSVPDNTHTINVPSGTANGNLMIAALAYDDTGTFTPPAGWTEVLDATSNGRVITVCYRVASSEPASYTWTASRSKATAGGILTYANATYDSVGSVAISSSTRGMAPVLTLSGSATVNGLALIFAYTNTNNTTPTSSMGTVVVTSQGESGILFGSTRSILAQPNAWATPSANASSVLIGLR